MDTKPIKSAADYKSALAAIESLMAARSGTADGDRLDLLATLVEAYEARLFAVEPPDAVTDIRFRMEQQAAAASRKPARGKTSATKPRTRRS